MKLFGEPVHVAAHICQMPGISGHADVNGLLDWAKAFEEKPQKVFVTHGDDTVTEIFAKRLTDELGYDTMAPFSGTVYDLADDVCLYEAKGVKSRKHLHHRRQQEQPELSRNFWHLVTGLLRLSGKMKERRIKIWKDFQEMFSPCVINGTGQICKLKKYPTKLYL